MCSHLHLKLEFPAAPRSVDLVSYQLMQYVPFLRQAQGNPTANALAAPVTKATLFLIP